MYLFAVRMGTPPELPLHSLGGIEAQLDVLELRQSKGNRPGLKLLQTFDGKPQACRFRRDTIVARLAERIAQRRAISKHAFLQDQRLCRWRIQLVNVDLHHERLGGCVGMFDSGWQAHILLLQKMHGACEVDGVMWAVEAPK